MNAPFPNEALAALEEMRERYFATPLAEVDTRALEQWQPRASLWTRLKPLMALQAGLRVRRGAVDGHRLSYWEGGRRDGPAVVLLHGFGASKENWTFLAARLRRRYRLLVPDLPGFGDSQFYPQGNYEAAVQADRIAGWLRQLGVVRAQLVGSSMGGAIAAQIAARHPQLAAGLCLMNAAGVPGARLSQLESGLAAGVNYLAPATRAETSRVFELTMHRRRRALGYGLGLLLAAEMSHRKLINDFLFGHLVCSLRSTYDCLPTIEAPGFVLWGAADQVLDVSCAEVFCERLPRARAMVLPDVGHLPMLETPALTARVLEDFWRSSREGTAYV